MESRGAKLKKIRLEKGLSLEEVHKKTKIHLNILKAIEEDNVMNLNPIYVKGFIKIYCKLLGENPADFIKDFKETRTRIELKREAGEKTFSDGSFLNLRNLKFPVNLRVVVSAIVVIAVIYVSLGVIKHIKSKPRDALSKKQPVMMQTAMPLPKAQKKSDSSKEHRQSGQGTPIRVGIRARENCFIQLKIDERLVFQGVLKKGRFESWQAKEKINLSLGNAVAVDLEVNGKLISNLGRKGQALKNIVITQEGLSIGR